MRSCPNCSSLQEDALGYCPVDGSRLGEIDPHLGTTLSGQFTLEERIGEGGCGDVYRAHQVGVERSVAVKLLHASTARQPEFAARFAREARAAAQLSHPNIVTIFQLGETPEGTPYIAMEWANATPIGRQEKLSYDQVLVAAVQIASALSEAHGAGIIHRDLKPENVLIGRRGGNLHVTLVDFGIAKLVNADLMESGETHLTRHGVVYGTPMYLSPEQAGDQPLDARADLYSFGVMLYELFAGVLPFQSQGIALLVDHLTSEPEHILEKVPKLDVRTASLVMRLLAKDPNARPASAMAVLAELQDIQRGPVDAKEPGGLLITTSFAAPEETIALIARGGRRPLGARAGLMVALLIWISSSNLIEIPAQFEGASSRVMMATTHKASEAAAQATPTAVGNIASVAAQGPQRALLVSANGYALRVLMPEVLYATAKSTLAVEVWDRAGAPLRSDAIVMVFTDADGEDVGVSIKANEVPGRYEVERRFSGEGGHTVQVFPGPSGVSLRVHFDVEPEAAPNT